jgi:hypothetical protein
MRPIRIPTLSPGQLDALERLYRTTREAQLRTLQWKERPWRRRYSSTRPRYTSII